MPYFKICMAHSNIFDFAFSSYWTALDSVLHIHIFVCIQGPQGPDGPPGEPVSMGANVELWEYIGFITFQYLYLL